MRKNDVSYNHEIFIVGCHKDSQS